MPATIRLEDLPADVRAKLPKSARPRKQRSMTMNEVRTAAIRVLAVVAELTPTDRRRVLRHAAKLNDV